MAVTSEDGVPLACPCHMEFPPTAFSFTLHSLHFFGRDDSRPASGLPRVPPPGRFEHRVPEDALRPLLAYAQSGLFNRGWSEISRDENVVPLRILRQTRDV